ncbi:uncharacterized protein EI97DRAFT_215119 [Westerdykella ornata]|uniref:Extracellular mutant protein 11 C-terminal domain-containing protein n=1 Tax=Westerdykella ornata TaxID=318751 RepID=A0A6A6JQV7_WESOR|nr:uncharacterized protein EI97DRAFT_215119 [Westerdykella ornata]KAF2278624.1 hypothetical protein EI97DRAFT_215119 [Westerdykella ornata]
MNSFVKNSHGGGGHSNGRPRSRQQVAANAKVTYEQVQANKKQPRVEANTAAQQHAPAQKRGIGQHDQPVGLRQLPQLGRGARMHQDAYGTDAESIDTTVQGGSVHPQQINGESDYGDDVSEGEMYDEEEEGEGEEDIGDQQYYYEEPKYTPHNLQELVQGVPADIRGQVQGRLAQYNQYGAHDLSYPSTTSGNPENVSDHFESKQESIVDEEENQSHISPTPQREVKEMFASIGPALQRPSSASELPHPAEVNRNIFKQGAMIRGNRPATVMGVRPVQQRTSTDPQLGLPHSNTQNDRHHAVPGSAHVKKEDEVTNVQDRQALPQRGAGTRRPLAPAPTQAAKPTKPVAIAAAVAPTRPPPPVTVQPLSPPSTEQKMHPSSPHGGLLEDYDLPALYTMEYEQLKNEDFDTVPRAPPPVLSEDMAKKPLHERLEHVHRSLDAVDQSKFFASIPTAEWEEAGEWFLEQFGEIMKRTREARQAKRKLAIAFEEEVEKRHRHVVKKQRQVDEALQKMSAQGQGLIPPKSPGRGSKSPPRR